MVRYRTIAAAASLVAGGSSFAQHKVLLLDGPGSHVAVPHHASQDTSTAMTIEYWASITQYSGRPVHKRSGSDGQFNTQATMQCGPAWGVEAFGVGGNNSTCLQLPPTQYRPALHGAWNHYAVTWSAASRRLRCYVNGVLVGDFANTGTAMRQSTDPLCFGDVDVWPDQDFRGRLDNVRLWNVERTQAQIATTAMTSFTPAQAQAAAGLIGSWTFDDGTAADGTERNNGTLNNGARIASDDWYPNSWSSPVPIAYGNADCNGDGVLDAYQIATSQLADTDDNGVPDVCGCTPPEVVGQPEALARRPGQTATFVATAMGGPVSHRWRRDGVPLVNGERIRGVDRASLVITDLTLDDQGSYDCEIFSACGSVVTTPAMLHIRTTPDPAVILSVVRETTWSSRFCGSFSTRHERAGAWTAPSPPVTFLVCPYVNSSAHLVSEAWPWSITLSTEASGFVGNQRSYGEAGSSFAVTFETATPTWLEFRTLWGTSTSSSYLGGPECGVRLERLSPNPVVLFESFRQLHPQGDWCCGIHGPPSCCRWTEDVFDCCIIDTSCCHPSCLRCDDDASLSALFPPGRYRVQAGASGRGTDSGGGGGGGSSATLQFSLTLDEAPCLADFNRDGGVDGQDVAAFFIDWESGQVSADINADGGVDGQDLFGFFDRWTAGC